MIDAENHKGIESENKEPVKATETTPEEMGQETEAIQEQAEKPEETTQAAPEVVSEEIHHPEPQAVPEPERTNQAPKMTEYQSVQSKYAAVYDVFKEVKTETLSETILLRVPYSVKKELEQMKAADEIKSVNHFINFLIRDYLDGRKQGQ